MPQQRRDFARVRYPPSILLLTTCNITRGGASQHLQLETLAKTEAPHSTRPFIRRPFLVRASETLSPPKHYPPEPLDKVPISRRHSGTDTEGAPCVGILQYEYLSWPVTPIPRIRRDMATRAIFDAVAVNGVIHHVLCVPYNVPHPSSRPFQIVGFGAGSCWVTRYSRPMQRCGGTGRSDQCQERASLLSMQP